MCRLNCVFLVMFAFVSLSTILRCRVAGRKIDSGSFNLNFGLDFYQGCVVKLGVLYLIRMMAERSYDICNL